MNNKVVPSLQAAFGITDSTAPIESTVDCITIVLSSIHPNADGITRNPKAFEGAVA
jgi:hypothetical protein